MFPGCPSVRPSGFFRLRDNSSITWWNFIKLGQKVKLDVTINWLDFGWNPPNVKGQRSIWSKYAISTSFTRNLKNPWVDFHQTWYRDAPPGVDKLIRFWARSAQRQGFKGQWIWYKYAIFTSFTRNLKNPWVDFHQTWYRGALPGVDELIRFWARSAQCQGSKVNELGINMLFLPRLREISRTPRWIFIKLGTGVPHPE